MKKNIKEEVKKELNPVTMLFGVGIVLLVIIGIIIEPSNKIIQNLPFGATMIVYLYYVSTGIIGVGLLYLCKYAMFYFVKYRPLIDIAKQTPEGAGRVLMAVEIGMIPVAIVLVGIWIAA